MAGLDIPMSDMAAGNYDQAAPVICYEDAFGELTRRLLPAAVSAAAPLY